MNTRKDKSNDIRNFRIYTYIVLAALVAIAVLVVCLKQTGKDGKETEKNSTTESKFVEQTTEEPVSSTDDVTSTDSKQEITSDEPSTDEITSSSEPETTTNNPPETSTPPETSNPPETTDTPYTRPEEPSEYPVPVSPEVSDSFFADAVFIGDSRTEGLKIYGGVKSTYYSFVGLNAQTALTKEFINEGGQSLTVVEALKKHPEYKKVYISFGVNEFWMTVGTFKKHYEKLLDEVIAACPQATIYVQSVFPLGDTLASGYAANAGNGLNNAHLSDFNGALLELAKTKKVCFVDVAEAFTQPDGRRVLSSSDSTDGIHLTTSGVKKLVGYLRTHT